MRYDLSIVEDIDSAALNARYLANRTDGLHLRGKAGRLCHAEVMARETIRQMTCRRGSAGAPWLPWVPRPHLARPGLRAEWSARPRSASCWAIRVGDPYRAFRSVLIAGTNGKGSTAATLASILNAAGLRAGLYTSPHLLRVQRAASVSPGRPIGPQFSEISNDDFAVLFALVDSTAATLVAHGELPHPPSFFELLTAIAFCFYAEQGIDIAVLEVGLGGRLDATNVVDPLLSIITDASEISTTPSSSATASAPSPPRRPASCARERGVARDASPQHPEAERRHWRSLLSRSTSGGVDASAMPPYRHAGAFGTKIGQIH